MPDSLEALRFDVPAELVAQEPAEPRDASRLMVVDRKTGAVSHHRFSDLPSLIGPEYALVLNDTRVARTKLIGRRSTTGEGFAIYLLKALTPSVHLALGDALTQPMPGETVRFEGSALTARLIAQGDDGTVAYAFDGVEDTAAELSRLGSVPLPPYIQAPAPEERYQTVFAQGRPESVAAPTAGLHFTPELLARLQADGHLIEHVTLHVGYGTFKRLQGEVSEHRMDAERYELTEATAERLNAHKRAGGKLLAVGTTSTRTLETLATGEPDEALAWGSGEADLFIKPGYRFAAVDALLTNFHMPGFTPIYLVAAFLGIEKTRAAYDEAIRERYRFFSFGDAMLIR